MVAVRDFRKNQNCQNEVKRKLSNRYWRLNNLYYVLNEQGERVLFNLNVVQYIFYAAMWWLNIVLKSRQHGISTFVAIFFLDACLFNSNVRAGIIAHKLEAAKRIFKDKVKYAYDNLPEELKKAIDTDKDDSCEITFNNNSSIYVGVSMRSGTLQYLHISELGWICAHAAQKAKEILSGAMETVHAGGIIIIESTAEGANNLFHSMCKDSMKLDSDNLSRMDYKFHFFPWYIKPENVLHDKVEIDEKTLKYFDRIERLTGNKIDQPHRNWYAKKKITLRGDIFKEHPSIPDEAFTTGLEGAYFGHEMFQASEEERIGNFPWERGAKVFTFWDVGSIHTAIWFWQFIKDRIKIIDCYYDNTGQGLIHYAKVLQDKPYIYAEHWTGWDMDPESGSNRKNTTTGRYIKDEARELGINFKILKKYPFKDRIEAGRMVLGKCFFNKKTTEVGINALKSFRQSVNQALTTEDRTVFNNNPEPGPECHIADAFTHGATTYLKHLIIDGKRMGQVTQDMPARPHTSKPYRNDLLTRQMRRTG